jgi:hypothetical protein
MGQLTLGDGNCFPRGVVQQLKRPNVTRESTSAGRHQIRDHQELRDLVAHFMTNPDMPVEIRNFKERYEETHRIPWATYWKEMRQDRVWADSIMLQGTAWYLHRDLCIVFGSAKPQRPFITIGGCLKGDHALCEGAPLWLGLTDRHYQSLVPLEDESFRPSDPQLLSQEDVLYMAEEGDVSQEDVLYTAPREPSDEESVSILMKKMVQAIQPQMPNLMSASNLLLIHKAATRQVDQTPKKKGVITQTKDYLVINLIFNFIISLMFFNAGKASKRQRSQQKKKKGCRCK